MYLETTEPTSPHLRRHRPFHFSFFSSFLSVLFFLGRRRCSRCNTDGGWRWTSIPPRTARQTTNCLFSSVTRKTFHLFFLFPSDASYACYLISPSPTHSAETLCLVSTVHRREAVASLQDLIRYALRKHPARPTLHPTLAPLRRPPVLPRIALPPDPDSPPTSLRHSRRSLRRTRDRFPKGHYAAQGRRRCGPLCTAQQNVRVGNSLCVARSGEPVFGSTRFVHYRSGVPVRGGKRETFAFFVVPGGLVRQSLPPCCSSIVLGGDCNGTYARGDARME